jgi:MoxR-like ATPase
VTVEGKSLPLPDPFLVIATQNPIDFHGTFPLPESQLDRFMLCMGLGYPDERIEAELITSTASLTTVKDIEPVFRSEEVCALQEIVSSVRIENCVGQYIVHIVTATRSHPETKFGVSPRGTLMLSRACQARAILHGRDYVIPDDVQAMAVLVLSHRLVLDDKSIYSGLCGSQIIKDIVSSIKVPV